jgi:hypothetical protein
MAVTLVMKKVKTAPLKIMMSATGVLNGYFTGHAKLRSKPEIKVLSDRMESEEFKDNDADFMHELFESFEGLPNSSAGDGSEAKGDEAWDEVLIGPFSSFLSQAAVQAYFAQYGEARQGNSARRR